MGEAFDDRGISTIEILIVEFIEGSRRRRSRRENGDVGYVADPVPLQRSGSGALLISLGHRRGSKKRA
jgi:hypothetical protein